MKPPARGVVPRYVQIAKQLAEAIATSRYAVGAKLPTEAELCKQYRISRYTAREALRQLRESGLISRRRGAGTTVAASTPTSTFRRSISSFGELKQYADDTRLRIERRARVTTGSPEGEMLGQRRGREWTRLAAVRIKPGEPLPICLTTVYLSPDVAPVAAKLPRETGAIHAVIESDLGLRIARIDQTIDAVTLDAATAKRLGTPPGSPGLRVIRRYYDANERLLEVSDSLHPGERYTYSMTMRRE